MSERSPISLVDAATGNTVDAVLVNDVNDDTLLAADQSWIPMLLQAAREEIARGIPPAPHSHWRWQNKTGTNRGGRRIIGIECGGEVQALIALCLDKKCRLPVQAGLPLVYVDYIETAPWNMKRYAEQPRFRGCGPRLIGAAVEISVNLGWAGRLGLHSLEEDDTLRFYRLVCGMTGAGPRHRLSELAVLRDDGSAGKSIWREGRQNNMKFKNDLAWVLAMDELQGDIPDPSSFRPAECEESYVPSARSVARGNTSGEPLHAASGAPAKVAPARGSRRSGYGGGSMSC